MHYSNRFYRIVYLTVCVFSAAVSLAQEVYKVGAGKVDITPDEPVVLAGYGSRTEPFEGVDMKLYARALSIGAENPHLVIAVDNCGMPKAFVDSVYAKVNQERAIDRASFVIAATHTHNAPSLPGYAPVLWLERMEEEEILATERYAAVLESKLVALALDVLAQQKEARLSWGQGTVTFGGNRRVLENGKWRGFGFQQDGPVDHSVPALIATNTDQEVVAVWTNYACHCTTLGAVNRVHADWAGVASEQIEREFPAAIALTTIGCGADVGPQPSGNAALSLQHGESLAKEVNRMAKERKSNLGPLSPLRSRLSSNDTTIKLAFASTFDKAYWEGRAIIGGFEGIHAREMLRMIEQDGSLRPDLDYRLATWKFGEELALLFLPGEVCVDYAVRLKSEHDWRRLWINGWSNAMPGYIPSKRVLDEGGYEADSSMLYYAHPSRFADSIEDKLVSAVGSLLGKPFFTDTKAEKRPEFFSHPGPADETIRAFRESLQTFDDDQRRIYEEVMKVREQAQPGFEKLLHSDFDETVWFDFLGRKTSRRPFVRQLKQGDRIEWETAKFARSSGDEGLVTICFTGGLGYVSQPATEGFELLVNNRLVLKFDVARVPSRWKNADNTLELFYLPTWKSGEDSAGFFLLHVNETVAAEQGASLKLAVRSLGVGSQRWFAVDRSNNVKDLAKFTMPK